MIVEYIRYLVPKDQARSVEDACGPLAISFATLRSRYLRCVLPRLGRANQLSMTEHEPRDDQLAPSMAAEPDPQQLLTALTTEHFTLQGARSQTVSESASRASLYLFSVSSTLVALGFIGQISTVGDTFKVFALTVLPTLYVLGLFTFVRLVQSVAEDFQYGRAINRIRHHYLELAGDKAHLFMMSAHDDAPGCSSTWESSNPPGRPTSRLRAWSQ